MSQKHKLCHQPKTPMQLRSKTPSFSISQASSSHRGESRRGQHQSHQHPKAPPDSQTRSLDGTISATLANPSSAGGRVTSLAPVRQLKPEKAAASQTAGDFALNLASQLLFVMIKATEV